MVYLLLLEMTRINEWVGVVGRWVSRYLLLDLFLWSPWWMEHAIYIILYVNSLTPHAFNPVTPLPAVSPRAILFPLMATSPNLARPEEEGMTATDPVNIILSPAFASSTTSLRHIISMHRGIDPAGISSAFSWTLSLCQSTNALSSGCKWNFACLPCAHWTFLQTNGSVYTYCCSTLLNLLLHSIEIVQVSIGKCVWGSDMCLPTHVNAPYNNSGLTSDVLVTVPLNDNNFPILSVCIALRIRWHVDML